MRTVSCLSSYRASRIAYGVDKQQPLTPCEYIVLPFRIVYIRSVSVVATHPTPYPILREFDKKDEFNNAFRSLMSDNLTEVSNKGTKKRLISMLKTADICRLLLNNSFLDESQVCIIQHTTFHYPFTKLVCSLVSKVCPVTIIPHHLNNGNNGFHQFLLQCAVETARTLRKPFRIPAIIIHGSFQVLCSLVFTCILYVHFY